MNDIILVEVVPMNGNGVLVCWLKVMQISCTPASILSCFLTRSVIKVGKITVLQRNMIFVRKTVGSRLCIHDHIVEKEKFSGLQDNETNVFSMIV